MFRKLGGICFLLVLKSVVVLVRCIIFNEFSIGPT